jgi:hypothetical protein
MRIRRMREKDIDAVAALMRRSGMAVGSELLAQRLKNFQYQRNHMVAVAEHRGKLLSLLHIGAEPSLTYGRCARVYALFVDTDAQPGVQPESLRAYMAQWAHRHGCDVVIEPDEVIKANKKGLG